jgi:MFS transporter, MHS family, proline/betaine transporter
VTSLIVVTGNALAPAWYVIGCGALGLVAVAFMDERSGQPLD